MATKVEVFFYGDTKEAVTALKKEGFASTPVVGDRKGVVLTKTVASFDEEARAALRKTCVELSLGGAEFDGIATSGEEV